MVDRKIRIGFFCAPGLDNFIRPIVKYFEDYYDVKLEVSTNPGEIIGTLEWADIIWLEWANELAIAITNDLQKQIGGKPVIVRLHSYEALHGLVPKLNWNVVHTSIFVAEHVRNLTSQQWSVMGMKNDHDTYIIPNGVDIDRFALQEKQKGYDLAFLGHISNKKGPMLLLHAFKALHDKHPEYKLHLGGKIQEARYAVYLQHFVEQSGLKEAVIPHGNIESPEGFFAGKHYILCSSPWEGCPVGLLEAMSCGLKPVIHHFPGADLMYPSDYLWLSIEQFIERITEDAYDPESYRNFVIDTGYTNKRMFRHIHDVIDKIASKEVKIVEEDKHLSSDVTAIVAVYNGEKSIKRAIDSILNQTFPVKKIIVVNDASTDNTSKILEEYGDRIKLITNKQNTWVYTARNIGACHAETDYMFFLDSDDWIDKTYVEKAIKLLEKEEYLGFAYPDVVHFDDQGKEKGFIVQEFDPDAVVNHNFISYCSVMKTKVFGQVGGYSDYLNDYRNHMTEWHLWLSIIEAGYDGIHLPEPMFHYYQDEKQMSKNQERQRTDMQAQMVQMFEPGIVMDGNVERMIVVCSKKDWMGGEYNDLVKQGRLLAPFFLDIEEKYFGKGRLQDRFNLVMGRMNTNKVVDRNGMLPEKWVTDGQKEQKT